MNRLLVDFNEVYDDECIWTSLRQMQVAVVPEPGETVELYDHDGERCWAVVESVAGPIVHARIKWSTWESAPLLSLSPLQFDVSEDGTWSGPVEILESSG